jgi:hypothetical protein
MVTTADIKRALREAGLEVYRTDGEEVQIAERPRENLIMDSGVRIKASPNAGGPTVTFLVRAERNTFPREAEDELFARARRLAEPAFARGYDETRSFVTEMPDPGDPSHILDRWCQVEFSKPVEDLDTAVVEARFVASLDKVAER